MNKGITMAVMSSLTFSIMNVLVKLVMSIAKQSLPLI